MGTHRFSSQSKELAVSPMFLDGLNHLAAAAMRLFRLPYFGISFCPKHHDRKTVAEIASRSMALEITAEAGAWPPLFGPRAQRQHPRSTLHSEPRLTHRPAPRSSQASLIDI